MAKPRTSIPTATAATVLFAADRTCCVCREPGNPIQIHHIDEDPTNHDQSNLAVLCLSCHEETQKRGGFARRLDADQVRLYRDNWNQTVAGGRSTSPENEVGARATGTYDAQLATSLVEINREADNWVNLAYLYDGIGNKELRDKAIDQAIGEGVNNDVVVRLRRLQGRLAEVPRDAIEAELDRLTDGDGYRSLAVLREDLGQYREAAEVYIAGLHAEMALLEDFTLAHHLKELLETEVIPGLFVQALQKAAAADLAGARARRAWLDD